jgi:hypothetical protein
MPGDMRAATSPALGASGSVWTSCVVGVTVRGTSGSGTAPVALGVGVSIVASIGLGRFVSPVGRKNAQEAVEVARASSGVGSCAMPTPTRSMAVPTMSPNTRNNTLTRSCIFRLVRQTRLLGYLLLRRSAALSRAAPAVTTKEESSSSLGPPPLPLRLPCHDRGNDLDR